MQNYLIGMLFIVISGTLAGAGTSPIKLMRRYHYEHWALISSLFGFVILPWSIIALNINIIDIFRHISIPTFVLANILSLSWGVANILCGLCLIRIGFSLTVGLLTGIGMPLGILVPLIFRGSGMSSDAPDIISLTGLMIIIGIIVACIGVFYLSKAGFIKNSEHLAGGAKFKTGFLMAVLAGIMQIGLSLSMVYSQPHFVQVLQQFSSNEYILGMGCSSLAMMGGVAVNVGFAIYLLCKNRSWEILIIDAKRDMLLSFTIAIAMFIFPILLLLGMKNLGSIGPSIGFGIVQIIQLSSSQMVGIFGGEWHNANKRAIKYLVNSLLLLFLAVIIFGFSKS